MLETISQFEDESRNTISYKAKILEMYLDTLCNAKVRNTEYRAVAQTLQSLDFDVKVIHEFDSIVCEHRIYCREITDYDIISAQNFLNTKVTRYTKSLSIDRIVETLLFLGLTVEKDDSGYYKVSKGENL